MRLMRSICSKCEDLPLLQKVEVFRHALNCTSGIDLKRVLWLQSRNSEVWLSRRTKYCRSLAVMSMVGYILGLGDRHPSNLMIDRESGQVVHIDFGDCFEIAAFRQRYPEKIPFRLTRMLLNALEVSGVEGNYRYTCQLVMSLLRKNNETVMAMLEAFVFDPLITWRLLPEHTHVRSGMHAHERKMPNFAYMSPLQPVFVSAQPSTKQGEKYGKSPQFDLVEGTVAVAAGANVGHVSGAAEGDKAIAEILDDSRRLPEPMQQHFVLDEPTRAEHDPHLQDREGDARVRELRQHLGPEGVHADPELLSQTARRVISRVYAKLNGTDFRREALDVEAQVERLFQEATSHENLCQCYVGWCPFW
jgi:FKBP12-rapamycin complex-associated protein